MRKTGYLHFIALMLCLCLALGATLLTGCGEEDDDDDNDDNDDDAADDDDDSGDDDEQEPPDLPLDHSPDSDCYNCHLYVHDRHYQAPHQCAECHMPQ